MSVELKYQDEVDQTLNINIEGEDAQKAMDLLHKGVRMNKIDKEFGELKREKEALSELFLTAKEDDLKAEQLIDYLSKEMGRELTLKEKQAIADPDQDYDPDNGFDNKVINDLKNEIAELKKGQVESQNMIYSNEMKKVENELSKKYSGDNGYPKYDHSAVDKFIKDKQFYMPDILENYEVAYRQMNSDKITEAEIENARKGEKNRKMAIDKSRTQSGDDSVTDITPKKTPVSKLSWEQIQENVSKQIDEEGKSLFKD